MARLYGTYAALTALLAGACAMTGEGSPAPQGVWIVEDVNHGGVIGSSRIEIAFEPDGGVSGSTGCNRFSGQHTATTGTIAFGPLATTRRACAPALNMQERRVVDALSSVETYSYDDTGALVLEGPAPHRILARRESP